MVANEEEKAFVGDFSPQNDRWVELRVVRNVYDVEYGGVNEYVDLDARIVEKGKCDNDE